ncbi:MAG: thiaminase II [Nitrososphaeria archaeon]|nr:thiaminase II [Nitrososphaeria archaeon]
MKSITEYFRKEYDRIWEKILNHPFVVQLYSGKLPLNKFKYYVIQDFNYLVGVTRVLCLAASKSPSLDYAKKALELAYGTVTGEMENYIKLLNELDIKLEEVSGIEPNPTNTAYMNFLAYVGYVTDFWTTMTAFLPCAWTYEEIAERNKFRLETNDVETYRKWCSIYLSKEYKDLVKMLRNIVDESPLEPMTLKPYFFTALRYEYMFWDAAYREETWPI